MFIDPIIPGLFFPMSNVQAFHQWLFSTTAQAPGCARNINHPFTSSPEYIGYPVRGSGQACTTLVRSDWGISARFCYIEGAGECGVISPSWRAFSMAAVRLGTPSRRYAPESRLRTVELETDIFPARCAVVAFG